MQEYPLTFPDQTAGIYALKNTKTGQMYLGETSNLATRYAEWRSAARGITVARSTPMRSLLERTDIEDWRFLVIRNMPGSNTLERRVVEKAAIRKLKDKIGELLTNTRDLPADALEPKEGCPPKSVLTFEGNTISYRQGAELLGCSIETFTKRLLKWRRKGKTQVSVEELQGIKSGRPSK